MFHAYVEYKGTNGNKVAKDKRQVPVNMAMNFSAPPNLERELRGYLPLP
jgi:hypothetical protein